MRRYGQEFFETAKDKPSIKEAITQFMDIEKRKSIDASAIVLKLDGIFRDPFIPGSTEALKKTNEACDILLQKRIPAYDALFGKLEAQHDELPKKEEKENISKNMMEVMKYWHLDEPPTNEEEYQKFQVSYGKFKKSIEELENWFLKERPKLISNEMLLLIIEYLGEYNIPSSFDSIINPPLPDEKSDEERFKAMDLELAGQQKKVNTDKLSTAKPKDKGEKAMELCGPTFVTQMLGSGVGFFPTGTASMTTTTTTVSTQTSNSSSVQSSATLT